MEKTTVDAFLPFPVAPIVLVGSLVNGKPNYLAVGFATGVNIKPPIVGISLNHHHHTVKGILEHGTFSINIPSTHYLPETDYCGLVSGKTVDKSSIFTTFYGELGTAPMIEECPIVCECRYTGQSVAFAMDTIYFGEVVKCYVNSDLYKKGKPADIAKIDPVLAGIDRCYHSVGPVVGKTYSIGWQSTHVQQSSPDGTEAYRCSITTRSPMHALTMGIVPGNGSIEDAVAQAFARIIAYAASQGMTPIDSPFMYTTDIATAEASFSPGHAMHAGMVFEKALAAEGPVETLRIPGGRYAQCLHSGAYDHIGDARLALHAYVRQHGFYPSTPEYEFYLNDPATTPSDQLQTLLLVPIRRTS